MASRDQADRLGNGIGVKLRIIVAGFPLAAPQAERPSYLHEGCNETNHDVHRFDAAGRDEIEAPDTLRPVLDSFLHDFDVGEFHFRDGGAQEAATRGVWLDQRDTRIRKGSGEREPRETDARPDVGHMMRVANLLELECFERLRKTSECALPPL